MPPSRRRTAGIAGTFRDYGSLFGDRAFVGLVVVAGLAMAALLGYVSGDLTVAMFLQRYPTAERVAGKLSYLKGLMYPNWFAWQIGSLTGIFLGSAIPTEWGLGFAGTLAILCIMVPLIINNAALCGVAVAIAVSVLAYGLPYKLGLLLAVLVGMVTSMFVEESLAKRKARNG